jgi:membrane protease YdiL (CAAX protease family)
MNLTAFTEIIRQITSQTAITDVVVCLAGLTLLSIWLLKTSVGRKALADCAPRRNNMPFYLPFIPLVICFGIVPAGVLIRRELPGGLVDWQSDLLDNLILSAGAVAAIGVVIFLARASFARRLKGFGLNLRTAPKDFFAAGLNLLSVWPVLLAVILLTTLLGRLLVGEDFQMEKHETLKTLLEHPQWQIRLSLGLAAVVVAPVFEEMVFRGLFQSLIRGFVSSPWLSILIAAGFFASVHANLTHWPVLFVLAMCMGYSYEKSGSLLRPIFIHAAFNATNVIGVFS